MPLEGGAANLELVLDGKAGKVAGWVLDGCGENAVRIDQKSIELKLTGAGGFDVRLLAVANALTGETSSNSSQFEAQDPRLVGLLSLEGTVDRIVVKGIPSVGVRFSSSGGPR